MTSKLILIAATALIAAPGMATTTAATKAAADAPKAGRTAAADQKYCIEYEKMTGSRVSRQECRTKKQWADEGVNVDELMKK